MSAVRKQLAVQKIGGWFFPGSDTVCASAAIQESFLIEASWLQHVRGRKVCVQAGGNCGLFPAKLAEHFEAVYTAEPDCENFACLAINCPAPNVYAFRAGFGKEHGTIGLHYVPGNAGGHWVDGEGAIPILTIDSLNLPACDLIALDIEGGEFNAVLGAEKTIEKYLPTLIIEDKGHVTRYGQTNEEFHAWLIERGYESRGIAWRDRIWVHP